MHLPRGGLYSAHVLSGNDLGSQLGKGVWQHQWLLKVHKKPGFIQNAWLPLSPPLDGLAAAWL